MNQVLPTPMTVEEFLRWSQRQERGRYELEGGRVVALPSETIDHIECKQRAYAALAAAIVSTGQPFYALPDGATVRIASDRAYEPDALVAALPKPPPRSLEVGNPIIVVEVLSPTDASARRDLTTKVAGYARVPSIEHCTVVDPMERVVLHYHRRGEVLASPDAPSEGTLRLDPPGLDVPVADLLGPEPGPQPAAGPSA